MDPDELGIQETRFPLQFIQPVVIASGSDAASAPALSNGTATLISLNGCELAVTCSHVVDHFRCEIASGRNVQLQIGDLAIDPIAALRAEDPSRDIAVFDVTKYPHRGMSTRGGDLCFFQPVSWPPIDAKVGEPVFISGYPGAWRQPLQGNRLEFDSFSLGRARVSSTGPDHFVCQFDRSRWQQAFGNDGLDLRTLGGMSGCPAFAWRGLSFQLVGIVYEYSGGFDLMYLRNVSLLEPDGTIVAP